MLFDMLKALHPLQTLVIGLILFLGIALRIYQLDHIPAINGDEAFPTVQMNELVAGRPVTLWVPTQRILSPLYASLVLAVNKLSPSPSFWTVRLPALIAGLLFIFLSFFSLRGPLGNSAALLTTLIVTALPMNIAYSRSAVEQCAMGAVGMFALSQALRGFPLATLIAFALGVIAHPVNVFLAPMLICLLLSTNPKLKKAPALIGFVAVIITLLVCLPAEYGLLNLERVTAFLLREPWEGIRSAWLFFIYFIRLISGVTALEYFSLPPTPFTVYSFDIFLSLIIVTTLTLALYRLRTDKIVNNVVLGFLMMAACLFYAAGPRALSPGLSRHANVLLAPFALTMGLCLTRLAPSTQQFRRNLWALSIVCIGFLLFFYRGYFEAIKRTGGGFTHRTYIAGPVEPKQAIFNWATNIRKAHTLLAEDWWIYWPLKYLSQRSYNEIEVVLVDDRMSQGDFLQKIKGGAIAVGFPGLKVEPLLREALQNKNLAEYRPESYSSGPSLTAYYFEDKK